MKPYQKKLALAGGALLALGAVALVFMLRPPVLVVTDVSFVALYGPRRIRQRQLSGSLALFRQVRPVLVADDAGADMIVLAIEAAVARGRVRPYCVLFSRRFAEGARRYRDQFPGAVTALLEGRTGSGGANSGGSAVFSTDSERDMYRAGRCAAVLSGERQETVVVFHDESLQSSAQEAFRNGLREENSGVTPVFTTLVSDIPDFNRVCCVVLAGSGVEYFERNLDIPAVFFTWLAPDSVPREAAVVFDDSPWALAVPAVKMLAGNLKEGKIPSRALVIPAKIADKGISRKLKNAARGR